MARKCKCKFCGKQLTTDTAWLYEYLTDDLDIKRKYYCNEECRNKEENMKLIYEDCFERLDMLLGFKSKSNIYLRKLLKDVVEVYGYESLQRFLIAEGNYIEASLGRIDFNSTNSKINYFMTILQSRVSIYKKSIDEERIQSVAKSVEVVEIVNQHSNNRKKKRKKRRSLDEIFSEGE